MAQGDVLYNQLLDSTSPVELGRGLTVVGSNVQVSSATLASREIGNYDINNVLTYVAPPIATLETFNSIQYQPDTTYWAITPYEGGTGMFAYHTTSAGVLIVKFDVKSSVPIADRFVPAPAWNAVVASSIALSPDGTEVWVGFDGALRIYKFTTTGTYLGYLDVVSPGQEVAGITTQGNYFWVVTRTPTNNPVGLTFIKMQPDGTVVDSFIKSLDQVTYGAIDSVTDVEFDPVNFAPDYAIWVRGFTNNGLQTTQFAYAFDVDQCHQPPTITASNKCIYEGDTFDPLDGVTATDCDGTDLTASITYVSTVDTTTPGTYNVVYSVQSQVNQEFSTKTIFIKVLAMSEYHQSITDVADSVAYQQAALATILNAEGAKIQRAIAMDLTTQQLYHINESVKDVVNSITMLESILDAKLQVLECDLCPDCYIDVTCTPVTDIIIDPNTTGGTIAVTKNSMFSFDVDYQITTSGNLTLYPQPVGTTIVAKTLIPGVTFTPNSLTFTAGLAAGQVVLTAGSGLCAFDITIDFNLVP